MAANVLYVEGKSLDDFLLGHVGLIEACSNRIGTFVDPTGLAQLDHVINALNAARAVRGVDCRLYTVLDEEAGVEIGSRAGCAVGTIKHPDSVLRSVELLISHGADAIGGVSVIHGVTADMFSRHIDGRIPNPSGGRGGDNHPSRFPGISAARSPRAIALLLGSQEDGHAQSRASAEFISPPHYFSVLKGLARAPRLRVLADLIQVPGSVLSINNVGAIVVPATCLGGIPALAAELHDIPLVAVRENRTALDVTNEKMQMGNVVEVESYLEAAGALLALRNGISLESLRRPLAEASSLSQASRTEARPRRRIALGGTGLGSCVVPLPSSILRGKTPAHVADQ